jgi:hypothetical protein
MTCDEKEAKVCSQQILKFVEAFFEMLSQWLKQVPTLLEYYPYMKKYPYLYLVWPEAAILNLHKSFITSLDLIFGASPRSEEFFKTSSSTLTRSSSLAQPKTKRFNLVSSVTNLFRFKFYSWTRSLTAVVWKVSLSWSTTFNQTSRLTSRFWCRCCHQFRQYLQVWSTRKKTQSSSRKQSQSLSTLKGQR